MRVIVSLLAATLLLAACGYKGPLYLPPPGPQAQHPAPPAPAPAPKKDDAAKP